LNRPSRQNFRSGAVDVLDRDLHLAGLLALQQSRLGGDDLLLIAKLLALQ
jgi:hypothetical protein